MKIHAMPIDLEGANEFVRRHHRHHQPVVGHKFSIGAALEGLLVGVAIIGRPVSRHRDDGLTLEVTRLSAAKSLFRSDHVKVDTNATRSRMPPLVVTLAAAAVILAIVSATPPAA